MTLIMFALALGFAAQSQTAPPAPALPSDFAVRFAYGLCTTDVLDTSNGSFVRDLGSQDPVVSISPVLPGESLREMYEDVLAARFFE